MKVYGDEKPSLEDLTHHGVKGMRWGARKTNPSATEIHAARQRQEQRLATYRSAKTGPQKASAKRDLNTNEDRVTAARMTLGEKVVTTMLGGPVGLVVVARNDKVVKKTAGYTDKARQVK